ncbi:MAG TPA: hypothetical protein VHE33_10090 [Acidobacteriaceae bacterium]|nr:hypothetical protein [Acidobacteriaceae bacterium]
MTNEVTEASAAEIIAWLRSPEGEAWSEKRLAMACYLAYGHYAPNIAATFTRLEDRPVVMMRGMFSIENAPDDHPEEAEHE